MNFLDSIGLIPMFPLFGALVMRLLGRKLDPQTADAHHHAPKSKFLISLLCPGTVLVSFLFSAGAVWQLVDRPAHTHQIIQFTWLAGLPLHTRSEEHTSELQP